MGPDEIDRIVRAVLRAKFKIEGVDPDAVLSEAYDFDSIDALEMLGALEDDHGIVLTQRQKKALYDHRTLRSIVHFLDEALRERAPHP